MKNKKACKACGKEIDKEAKECPHCGEVQVAFLDKHRTITIVIILIIILSILSIVIPISETPNSSNDTATTTEDTESTASSSSVSTEATATTDKQSDEEKSSKEEKDDNTVSAHKLATAYNNDQEKADKLYKDKVENIKGRIADKGIHEGETYVILDSDDPFSAVKVECLFNEQSQIDKLPNLAKGEEVTVKGKVIGQSQSVNVQVDDCVL